MVLKKSSVFELRVPSSHRSHLMLNIMKWAEQVHIRGLGVYLVLVYLITSDV